MNKIHETNINQYKEHFGDHPKNPRIVNAIKLFETEKINSILDIGCMNGNFLKQFPEDVTKYGIDIVKRNIPKIIFKVENIEKGIPYKDNFFDSIFAGEVIEHLIDTDFFIKECYRCLKPNGILVLTTPNLSSLWNLSMWFKKDQPKYIDIGCLRNYNNKGHVRGYSVKALKYQLKLYGFKNEKIVSDNIWFPLWNKNRLTIKISEFLVKLFPERGNSIIIKSRK